MSATFARRGSEGGSEPRHPDALYRRGGDRRREEARRGDRDAGGTRRGICREGLFGAPAWLMLLRPPIASPGTHPAPCGFRIGRSDSAAGRRAGCKWPKPPARSAGAFVARNAGYLHGLVKPREVISLSRMAPPHGGQPMTSYQASLWREMAKEALVVADRVRDPGVQREMILMAARYMAMAARVEDWAAADHDKSE